MLSDAFIDGGSRLVFNLALPALLFLSIGRTRFEDAANLPLIAFGAVATVTAFLLLEWLADKRGLADFRRGAEAINRGIDHLVKSPETRTRDLGGQLGTKAFTQKLCEEIERSL